MGNAYRKNVSRTINNSYGRYIAIMLIIALGVGFFAGLKVTKGSMISTGETYLSEHYMYDFKLVSDYGIDQNEVADVWNNENVLSAEGVYYEDFIYSTDDDTSEYVIKAYNMPETINSIELVEGDFPVTDEECLLDAYVYGSDMIGKKIIVSENNLDETKEHLNYTEYTVVGLVNSPLYLNNERGISAIGDGKVKGFAFMPDNAFTYELYKEMYVICEESYDIYSEEYEEYIAGIKAELLDIFDNSVQLRYQNMLDNQIAMYNKTVSDIETRVTEETREYITEVVRKNMYSEYMREGFTESLIDAMFLSGQAELPYDEIEAAVEIRAPKEIRKQVAEVPYPELAEPVNYCFDRTSNVGYMCFDNDTNVVDGVAKVFPLFFFFIAALVCSTTMTRMIDDERGQLGIYKALGYSDLAVIYKYVRYSGSAAIVGSLLGFFGGTFLFPLVIWKSYGMIYSFNCDVEYYFSAPLLVGCIIAALVCSVGVTLIAVMAELKQMPEALIRPKAPAPGKRIWLETKPKLWKRFRFLHKVAFRNVFRFKKRMLMMVAGIAGCTALVLTGLGIKDSISNIADFQYDEIDVYDVSVLLASNITDELLVSFEAMDDKIKDYSAVYNTTVNYSGEDGDKTIYLMAGEQADFEGYMNFDIISGTNYPEYGEVMLSKKLADIAGVHPGDAIELQYDGEPVTLKVSGIYQNYVNHRAVVTSETLKEYFGVDGIRNTLLINAVDDNAAYEIGALSMDIEEVMNVSVVSESKDRVSNMMKTLNSVVWLVIGCAGALAFIVLFNLSNINITERIREIATIKVLGFYPAETGAYVFRENLILTIMGIVVGLPLGAILHRFVISQIKVDMVAFKARIFPLSYLLCILIVLAFLCFVDIVMRRKLDKINMAESLKSVE